MLSEIVYDIGIVGYLIFKKVGDKVDGDVYTCSLEVEFKNVTATDGSAFGFRAHYHITNSFS